MQDQFPIVDPDHIGPEFAEPDRAGLYNKDKASNISSGTRTKIGQPTHLRFSEHDYYREVEQTDRNLIESRLSSAVTYFIEHGRSVYLDGFGVVFPKSHTGPACHIHKSICVVRHETNLQMDFEKCGELVNYHRRKYQNLVELRELSARIYPELPLQLQLHWSERDFRRILRGLCRYVRSQVVEHGYCRLLNFGAFHALHNRQGTTAKDWFAGADIFMRSNFQRINNVGPHRLLERPVLRSSWELLEAVYGKPLGAFSIDIAGQLKELGYCDKAFQEAALETTDRKADSTIEVAVFHARQQSKPDQQILIYCTDGLRRIATVQHQRAYGNEFVFQLAISGTEHDFDEESIPAWPKRPLTLAWILLQSSRTRTVDIGAGIASDVPLIKECDTDLRTIFTSHFATAKSEQLSEDGPFSFINIVAITEEEAQVARKHSPERLLTLLEHRKLDQITRTTRSSLVAKSSFLE